MRKLITLVVMTAALLGTGAQASWAGDDNHPHCISGTPGCHHK